MNLGGILEGPYPVGIIYKSCGNPMKSLWNHRGILWESRWNPTGIPSESYWNPNRHPKLGVGYWGGKLVHRLGALVTKTKKKS